MESSETGAKLYVGGISFRATEQDIEEAFAQAGAVSSVQIITERETGRSRGFCFVEMESADAAQAAIAMWNDQEHMGRRLIVNVAKPRQPRNDFGGGNGGGNSRW